MCFIDYQNCSEMHNKNVFTNILIKNRRIFNSKPRELSKNRNYKIK